MEAEITLTYDSEAEAKAIAEAVSPDNIVTPKDLIVETKAMYNRVVTTIRYDGDNIATFMSTIDDLLSCIGTAEKILSAIRE
ncbi:MAG: KEOPS complex subunit Pcc1, partial [Candidatus Bathyarchaeia archaeon]